MAYYPHKQAVTSTNTNYCTINYVAHSTKTIMNSLVDEVRNAQRAVTLHPQLGRKKANQFFYSQIKGEVISYGLHKEELRYTHNQVYMVAER